MTKSCSIRRERWYGTYQLSGWITRPLERSLMPRRRVSRLNLRRVEGRRNSFASRLKRLARDDVIRSLTSSNSYSSSSISSTSNSARFSSSSSSSSFSFLTPLPGIDHVSTEENGVSVNRFWKRFIVLMKQTNISRSVFHEDRKVHNSLKVSVATNIITWKKKEIDEMRGFFETVFCLNGQLAWSVWIYSHKEELELSFGDSADIST